MTFRRLKKVNSSGPESGPASSQDNNDIYFPSSKSDSCRTAELPSGSSDVYNYRTLAYSGGTLPRNFKKVQQGFISSFSASNRLVFKLFIQLHEYNKSGEVSSFIWTCWLTLKVI